MPFRLIKINELPELLTPDPVQYIAIDIPDVTSPTGYTTYKILSTILIGAFSQSLEQTLQIGSTTGGSSLQISDPANPLRFLDLVNLTKLDLIQPTMLVDLAVNLPSESGTLALHYDSGTKNIPIYNGSYGLADTGAPVWRPTIRIIGRTVHVDGVLLLPMPTVAGGVILDTDGANYYTSTHNYGDLYLGAGDGYQITAQNNAFSLSPILPSVLRPVETVRFAENQIMTRTLNIPGTRIRLSSYLNLGAILTDGRLLLNGIESSERNGTSGPAWEKSQHTRKVVDRFLTNDSMLVYDNYFNSFDNAGTIDNRVTNLQGYKYTFDFDGTTTDDYGGMIVITNFTYDLDPLLTLDQIKTAFDSL